MKKSLHPSLVLLKGPTINDCFELGMGQVYLLTFLGSLFVFATITICCVYTFLTVFARKDTQWECLPKDNDKVAFEELKIVVLPWLLTISSISGTPEFNHLCYYLCFLRLTNENTS